MTPLLFLADIAVPRVVNAPLGPHLGAPVAALLTFLAVFVVEAVLLRLLRWGGWGHVCLVSFVINLVTTLLGVVLAGVGRGLPWALWLALTFALTVVIEAGLLRVFQPAASFGRALVASLVINAASYALLAVLVALFAGSPGSRPSRRYPGEPTPPRVQSATPAPLASPAPTSTPP